MYVDSDCLCVHCQPDAVYCLILVVSRSLYYYFCTFHNNPINGDIMFYRNDGVNPVCIQASEVILRLLFRQTKKTISSPVFQFYNVTSFWTEPPPWNDRKTK